MVFIWSNAIKRLNQRCCLTYGIFNRWVWKVHNVVFKIDHKAKVINGKTWNTFLNVWKCTSENLKISLWVENLCDESSSTYSEIDQLRSYDQAQLWRLRKHDAVICGQVEMFWFSVSKSCWEWFRRFKRGHFSVKDKERSGQPKKFKDQEMGTLLDQYSYQT